VVRPEVKRLASQTAEANQGDRHQHYPDPERNREAVEAIRGITATIEEVSAIATTIAPAESRKTRCATRRRPQRDPDGAEKVTTNIGGVSGGPMNQWRRRPCSDRGPNSPSHAEQQSGEVNVFLAGVCAPEGLSVVHRLPLKRLASTSEVSVVGAGKFDRGCFACRGGC